VAGQGTRLGRAGRVHVTTVDGDIWVGGDCVTCITGTVDL
jgi:predicted PhzF superfamily epimerase YddE/YHI9